LGEFTVSRIDAILSIANPTGFAIALSDFINSRPTPFERMSPGEQAAYCVDELEREVNNGGFEQFFLNSSGDYARPVVDALQRIGATQAAQLVDRAIAPFGTTGPSPDRDTRTAQVEILGEPARDLWNALTEAFLKYPDDLTGLLRRYVEANKSEFAG
jgi:hypothetical protein